MSETTAIAAAAPQGWRLTREELAATRARVAKLNARAAAKGLTGHLDVAATREVTTEDGIERVWWRTHITGEPPRLGGWTFLAAVDTITTTTGAHDFIVRAAPGVETTGIDRDRLRPGACEHCGTTRARTYTYLLGHEDGRTIQVGKSCLADFVGLRALPTFFFDTPTQDAFTGGPRGRAGFSARTVLALTDAAVSLYGWTSRAVARERDLPATADTVLTALIGTSRDAAGLRAELADPLTSGYAMADTILAELPDLLAERAAEGEGYAMNLRALLTAEEIDPHHIPLLCSAHATYTRALDVPAAAPEEAAPERASQWIGTRGEPIEVEGLVTIAATCEGYMPDSTTRLIVADTEEGQVKMFTSAAWAYQVSEGDVVRVRATVKDHDTYRETKQTVLTRPRQLPVTY